MQTATTNIRNIKSSEYLAMPVPVPPLAEQEKIVEILEEQLSRLDAALVSMRAVGDKAAQFRRSLLHAALTGASTGHDPSTISIPAGWRIATIGDVGRVTAGRTPSKFEQKLSESPRSDRHIPFFKVGDMNATARYLNESRVYFAEDEAGSFGIELLEPGTVIFPKAGGAIATNKKRVLKSRGAVDLNCMAVAPTNILDERLLYWFFESFNLSDLVDGSVLPQIGKRRVLAIQISFPIERATQGRLVELIEENISRVDAVAAVAEGAEKRVAVLRRSLLHAAFMGKLTEQWREDKHV